MPNYFAALLSDSEDEGQGPTKTKGGAVATKTKPANPAVALAKSRNPNNATKATSSKPNSSAAQTQAKKPPVSAQLSGSAGTNTKAAAPANNSAKQPQASTPTGGPIAGAGQAEKALHTRDYRNSHNTRGAAHTRGGARGGRGGGGGGSGGRVKREFDRRSGTGRGKEMKKEGHGAHNWGDATDSAEVDQVLKQTATHNLGLSPDATNSPTAEGAADAEPKEGAMDGEKPEETEAAPVEEEKPEFTFEEFLAKKAEKRAGIGFEELQEVEVEDIQDGRAYAKKDAQDAEISDAYFLAEKSKGNNEVSKKKKEKKDKAKVAVDTGFTVKGADEGYDRDRGRERGGRGGGRGGFRGNRGGGRGGSRGGFSGYAQRGGYRGGPIGGVDTSETNFPSLGA